jgi:maltooligosyltrehalose trehalohydrolase
MMIANAAYWIEEFHLDGLRLDATQNVYDSSDPHILGEVVQAARQAADRRSIIVTAENEEQRVRHLLPIENSGCGMDALWNDDWHHTAMVALTGRAEAYYSDYKGTPQEFVSAAKHGFLYQGQHSCWQDQSRGTPSSHFQRERFVIYLENHDQIANEPGSRRCIEVASAGVYRALTAVLLLSPSTPLLFQGQEFGARTPFFFFAGHKPELAAKINVGRKEFLSQFPSQSTPEAQASIPDASARSTFERCKLDWSKRDRHPEVLALFRDLLRLRREDPILSQQPQSIDGAVLSDNAFLLRWLTADAADRLLLVNMGTDLPLAPCPEPLLAPPADRKWELAWSSEDVRYGGLGTPAPDGFATRLPGHSAQLYIAHPSRGS